MADISFIETLQASMQYSWDQDRHLYPEVSVILLVLTMLVSYSFSQAHIH